MKPFKDSVDLQMLLGQLMSDNMMLSAQFNALKQILHSLLEKYGENVDHLNSAYIAIVQDTMKRTLDNHVAFSKPMTDQIRSQLKDIPGLDLGGLG